METQVLNYLTKFKNVYTKTLYKALHIKQQFGLSLNKFRLFLHDLEKQGKIQTSGEVLPYWNVK